MKKDINSKSKRKDMRLDSKRIINEFLQFRSSREIAEKYDLNKEDVRIILRNALPSTYYLKIAHTIGAKNVSIKLNNPEFKRTYSKKDEKIGK